MDNAKNFKPEEFKALSILNSLKDFQKRSAINAFKRLYLNKNSTSRFLIADEVGLGKTLICRGLIALAIEKLVQEEDFLKGNNIDILYICSNQDIAGQNIRKLNFVNKEESFASRITLIPEIYSNKSLGRVRFISFTPDTSFNVKRGGGVMKERAMLYYFLKDIWEMNSARAKSLYFFKGEAGGAGWESFVQKNCHYWDELDLAEYSNAFKDEVLKNPMLKEKFLVLRESFPQYNSKPSAEIKLETSQLIGELRKILARVCLFKMSPDLVIMDEFQRFKNLFDESTEVGELAKYLFEYPQVKTILLSATPYKMYTVENEKDENHFDDFIATTSWLLKENENELLKLKTNLEKFRMSVFNESSINFQNANESKNEVERILRLIMSRTERVKSSKENDGMIFNNQLSIIPTPDEMISFVQLEEIAKALDLKGNVDYWKSSPYLLNLMEEYDIKRKFLQKLNTTAVKKSIEKYPDSFINKRALENYEYISPKNSRLNAIQEEIFKNESWKLLWVPPTAPYYKLSGVFEKFNDRSFTKSLVFSSWKVVPRAVASLISHEAESKAYLDGPYKDKEVETYKKSKLLTIGKEGSELKGLRTFILLYPSLSLIHFGDILKFDLKSQLDSTDILKIVKDNIKKSLDNIVSKYKKKEAKDENWYWAAPILLDRESHFKEIVKSWMDYESDSDWFMFESEGDQESVFFDHVERYGEVFKNGMDLGAPPDDLLEILALIALVSPSNVIYRSLLNIHKNKNSINELNILKLLTHSTSCAFAMRTLFDSNEAISIIKNVNDDSYWTNVLRYSFDGNLQSVCDEYFHILKVEKTNSFLEGLEVTDKNNDPFFDVADAFQDVCMMRKSNLKIDIFESNNNKPTKVSTRCKFALEYGQWKNEDDEEKTRAETVRDAFNSPFRPFVLATTSVGQEGLDFHQYCHSIFHWNLPRNPVDLEQREGRIHRFKGHVIRKNVATEYNILSFNSGDVWDEIFKKASNDHKSNSNDMIPYWIFDKKYKVIRNVPIIPFSKDDMHFKALIKTLALYRLAFGQPRQDELLKVLENSKISQFDVESLQNLMIDLSPPE